MAQLVRPRDRDRYNQPKHPSPLSSPPPTLGGDQQPTSLFRRPDLILLPDGRRISIYEDRHGVLVTDALRWSTRPVEDVYMEVLYDLQTSPRDLPPPIAEPVPRRHRGRDAHQPPIRCILPDKRIIHAYNDRHGVLVTDDMDGSTRRVEDLFREVISDLPRYRPPPHMAKPARRHHLGGDPHKPLLILCLLPDDRIIHAYSDMYGFLVTKDMNGLTRPVQDVFREVLYDLWTRPRDSPPPVVDATEEDQTAAEQTATPSPHPSGSQFIDDLLNRASVAQKLKLAQMREDREPTVLASKELLGTTTLEESSITNALSLLQPTLREDKEPNVLTSKGLLGTTTLEESITNASSLLQPTLHEDREPNVLASKELLDTTTLESITNASSPLQPTPLQPDMLSSKGASSTWAEEVTHSLTPPILARKPAGWNHQFFIRVDLGGFFHTYPELGGPFRSLEEANKAILCHLEKLRDRKM
ncbi:uncharacterized protein LOC119316896 isoform X2 [Triticum dicoccoides]|nr:uncharacterized protein LOC119316896 isoform X2 [Triticum dicoccoides]